MELTGAETLELVYAMNYGHDGCLFSLHANHPRDALSRLERMLGMGDPEIPLRAMRERISSAVDVIVQIERMRDGSRKITHICEVSGIDQGVITLSDLFLFDITGYEGGSLQGSLRPTGIIPRWLETVNSAGISLPVSLFTPKEG
jgi:pilus assembly protein CpaF